MLYHYYHHSLHIQLLRYKMTYSPHSRAGFLVAVMRILSNSHAAIVARRSVVLRSGTIHPRIATERPLLTERRLHAGFP